MTSFGPVWPSTGRVKLIALHPLNLNTFVVSISWYIHKNGLARYFWMLKRAQPSVDIDIKAYNQRITTTLLPLCTYNHFSTDRKDRGH